MYRLLFLNGKFKGKRLTIQQGSLLIGRDPECQVDLDDDDEVSRNHAIIEFRGGSPVIRDMGATNTVEVNRQPVKEHRLRNGDRIEVGRTVMEYQSGSSAAPPRTRHRFSKMQATAFGAIALVVLLQLLFVILFPLWERTETVQVGPGFMLPPAPAALATVEEEAGAGVVAAEPAVPAEPAVVLQPIPLPDEEPPEAPGLTGASAVVAAAATATNPVVVPVESAEPELVATTAADPEPAPAPAPVPAADPAAGEEVRALRSEIEDLRKQVESIAAVQPAVEERPTPPVMPAVDPLLAKSREMLNEAQQEIRMMNYVQADNMLERVTMMAPDFVPAYRERALLYEKRGMLAQAGGQWEKIMKLSAGTPLYEQAAAERQRVARLEVMRRTVSDPVRERNTATSARKLAKRLRITSVERERFQANEEFDEMRLVRVTLRPRNNEGAIASDQVEVVVTFYDRVIGSNRIVPTRALVPEDGVMVSGAWPAGEARTVTAAYILKKGFRADEKRELGETRDYEGFRVMVYYRGELQDENAVPRSLSEQPVSPRINQAIPTR
jgi:hypothetical protein